jgi:hypothetical protein
MHQCGALDRPCASRLRLEGCILAHTGCMDGAGEWNTHGGPTDVPPTLGEEVWAGLVPKAIADNAQLRELD